MIEKDGKIVARLTVTLLLDKVLNELEAAVASSAEDAGASKVEAVVGSSTDFVVVDDGLLADKEDIRNSCFCYLKLPSNTHLPPPRSTFIMAICNNMAMANV